MYQITINNNEYDVAPENGSLHQGAINGVNYHIEMFQSDQSNWVIEKDGITHRVQVVQLDTDTKKAVLRINGRKYSVSLKDKFDRLLKDLGLEHMAVKVVREIKSPMPGLVLDVFVSPGDVIKKGDQVLVLEAMKMENILKSQTDAVVKSVEVEKGVAVEKNEILIKFE